MFHNILHEGVPGGGMGQLQITSQGHVLVLGRVLQVQVFLVFTHGGGKGNGKSSHKDTGCEHLFFLLCGCFLEICDQLQEPTKPILFTNKQPIRTRYLGHVIGYQPIRDRYFLIRSVLVS
eukprot:sb/3476248/